MDLRSGECNVVSLYVLCCPRWRPIWKGQGRREKGVLTRETVHVDRIIEERDYDDILNEKKMLKSLFRKFQESHDSFHSTLADDDEIAPSEIYFVVVSELYTKNMRKLNSVIDLLEPDRARFADEPVVKNGSLATLAQLMNLPPLKIETFSGMPEEFDVFITTFDEVVGRVTPDAAARLIRLKSHLSGKASDAVRSCRSQGGQEAYKNAMSILRERFGSPHTM